MFSKYKNTLTTIGLFLVAFLLAVSIKAYIVQPYVVDGQSMETTLQNNDRLLVNKIPRTISRIHGHTYIPKRGNIIIFTQSNLPGFDSPKQLIKRVIGLPGDRVVIKDGLITIFNSANPKGFNPDTTLGYKIASESSSGSLDITLNNSQLFVCGDNRNFSEDSRFFGPIDASQIVGKLSYRIIPITKASHY